MHYFILRIPQDRTLCACISTPGRHARGWAQLNWERNKSVHEVIPFSSFTQKMHPFEQHVRDRHNTIWLKRMDRVSSIKKMRFDNITPKLFRYITIKKQMWSLHLFLPPCLAHWWRMRRCDSVVAGVASVMSLQDELICVRLVMPHCMFGMQLFLSEIVKFRFDRK